jgi:biopolymer transport protein ExbB
VIPADAVLAIWTSQGIVMLALHGVAVLAIAAVIDRTTFWLATGVGRRSGLALRNIDTRRAGHVLAQLATIKGRGDFLVRIARSASGEAAQFDAAASAARRELLRMDARMGLLDWSVAVAPLLGILGTATGIAVAFNGRPDGLPDPGAVANGIALALKTTIWGLSISVLAATARCVFRGARQRAFDRIQVLMGLISGARHAA